MVSGADDVFCVPYSEGMSSTGVLASFSFLAQAVHISNRKISIRAVMFLQFTVFFFS